MFLGFSWFFQIHSYYQSVKQLESRSSSTSCRAWSWSKVFAKVISRRNCNLRLNISQSTCSCSDPVVGSRPNCNKLNYIKSYDNILTFLRNKPNANTTPHKSQSSQGSCLGVGRSGYIMHQSFVTTAPSPWAGWRSARQVCCVFTCTVPIVLG